MSPSKTQHQRRERSRRLTARQLHSRFVNERRRRKHSGLNVETLESRALLADGAFATIAGSVSAPRELDTIPLEIAPANFRFRDGHVMLAITMRADGAGNTLDPGKIELVSQSRANRVRTLNKRIDISTEDNTSFNLSRAAPGTSTLRVRAEGTTRGAYEVQIFLAGDVNGNFRVEQRDPCLAEGAR